MSKFKPGDKVIVIASPYKGSKVHTVQASTDRHYPLLVGGGTFTAEGTWYSTNNMVCLRHALAEEITAAESEQKPKPLRRGDLVMWNGEIHMVFDDHPDSYGEYRAVNLTGECGYDYMPGKELIWIGSIRKKIKRIKNEMEGRNAT